jgi:pyruvate formate lyase activating enzyme
MIITALTKFTALDYPGKLACIIFTGGCNLRCGFCHNAEFVLPEKLEQLKGSFIPFETVKNFLASRRGMLDGVVICGGEPTIQPDLIDRMKEIKAMGYALKLDTNGANPEVLERALKEGLVDFVAMDIKDTPAYRKDLVGVTLTGSPIEKSIKLIKESGVDYEFRTTVIPEFHNLEKLREMGEAIRGARIWALQAYRNFKTLKPEFSDLCEYSQGDLKKLAEELKEYSKRMIVR